MRINYFLVAEAMSQSADHRLNMIGAGWTRVVVPEVGHLVPIAIAFGASGDERDVHQWPIKIELHEPNGQRTSFMASDFEATHTNGPPGTPAVSFSGSVSGILKVEMAGLHRLTLDVGELREETVFVVYVIPPKPEASPPEQPARRKRPRRKAAVPAK